MANAALCKYGGKWILGICAKIKRVTYGLAVDLNCREFKVSREYVEDEEEKLLNDVEAVTDHSYPDDIIYSGSGCQAVVTPFTRLGWVEFRDQ